MDTSDLEHSDLITPSAFCLLLASVKPYDVRITNAVCNSNRGSWGCKHNPRFVTDGGMISLSAVREGICTKSIMRRRNFGKKCFAALCEALNETVIDPRPRCQHCGQVLTASATTHLLSTEH